MEFKWGNQEGEGERRENLAVDPCEEKQWPRKKGRITAAEKDGGESVPSECWVWGGGEEWTNTLKGRRTSQKNKIRVKTKNKKSQPGLRINPIQTGGKQQPQGRPSTCLAKKSSQGGQGKRL